jgi:hypothetical protein
MRELYLRTPKAMRMLRQFAQEIRGREEPQQEAVAEIVRALID